MEGTADREDCSCLLNLRRRRYITVARSRIQPVSISIHNRHIRCPKQGTLRVKGRFLWKNVDEKQVERVERCVKLFKEVEKRL